MITNLEGRESVKLDLFNLKILNSKRIEQIREIKHLLEVINLSNTFILQIKNLMIHFKEKLHMTKK